MHITLLERMDRETRALSLLALAALVFVVAAAFALASSSRVVKPAFEPEPFFPELTQKLDGVREIVLQAGKETLRIARSDEGQWVLPDKDNYPVRKAPLREILLGLDELVKVQPATSNEGWFKELRLGAPEEGGGATRVSLKGKDGTEFVSLLVGEKADLPDISGLDSWYVRVPGEKQSWLARGTLSLRLDPAAWIVTDVVPLKVGRIRSATITPPQGPAYTVARKDEKAQGFTLMNLPEGATIRGPGVADSVGQAIADLKIKDARLASDFNFANAPVARYRTFDGLEITVRTQQVGEDIWATIDARFDGQPEGDAAKSFDASSQAANINQHVAGWAFLLPPPVGKQMRLPVSELVTQPATPDPATPEGTPAPEGAAAPAKPEAEKTAAASAKPAADKKEEAKAPAEKAGAPAEKAGKAPKPGETDGGG